MIRCARANSQLPQIHNPTIPQLHNSTNRRMRGAIGLAPAPVTPGRDRAASPPSFERPGRLGVVELWSCGIDLDPAIRPVRQYVAQHRGCRPADRAAAGRPGGARVARARCRGRGASRRIGDLGRGVRDAGVGRDGDRAVRRRLWPPADRLDHPERRLPLQPDGGDRPVRGRQAIRGTPLVGSARAGAARRLLVRRLHRRGRRVRHAGRHLLGAAHGARLLAASRRQPVADRQHRPGRVRRDAKPRSAWTTAPR